MKWYESALAYLFPTILIDSTPWRSLWEHQQNESFVRLSRFAFPTVAVGYVGNYFFFDVPMGLEPLEFWFKFRMSIAALCLVTFFYYASPLSRSRYYKIPAYITSFAVCYTQAWVTIWYGREAWVFFFLFVLVSTLVLRLTAFQSIAWGLLVIGVSLPIMVDGEVGTANLMSGAIACLVVSVIIRSTAFTDVRLFLSNQENEATQAKLLEVNTEYADRVKSFIPRVIANRLTRLMDDQRLSVVEASIEALKARKKNIACLFTDIRGFTQGSKDIDSFVSESVMPEVTACSRAIEDLQGIPRKVGDLIFAYFDDDDLATNLVRSLLAGIEVSRINETMNATAGAVEIRRYILISTGEAIVGNFGGLDSSVEITALGSPVNLLSRVDDLTKHPAMVDVLRQGDLIMCEDTANLVVENKLGIGLYCLDLKEMDLEIRDFPEVRKLYRLTNRDEAFDSLSNVALVR